jgi:HIV Tat-specific factor 1
LLKREKNKKKAKRQAEKRKEKWYCPKINTFVYISGLPLDITEEELKDFMTKAGILRIDLNTGKEKLKLYRDESGFPKGDAAVSYAKEESVDLAIENLNNNEIRSGFIVRVERAQFNQKQDDYKPR